MRVILGIGNPGREYDGTRHNLGFAVLDELARRAGMPLRAEKRFNADLVTWDGPDGRVLLVKPRTFVNRSGETAQALLAFHKLPPTDLLVVVDDLNLPTGHLRLRADGSAGGHNGLRDIEARLGQVYARLRCGCGPLPPGAEQVAFVLGGFHPAEREDAAKMVLKAADACAAWVRDGVTIACRFNGPLAPPLPRPKPPAATSPDSSSTQKAAPCSLPPSPPSSTP